MALLAPAAIAHFRRWLFTPPPTPVVLSLTGLDTAADRVLLYTSLLVRVNDTGAFFMRAWDGATLESLVAAVWAWSFW